MKDQTFFSRHVKISDWLFSFCEWKFLYCSSSTNFVSLYKVNVVQDEHHLSITHFHDISSFHFWPGHLLVMANVILQKCYTANGLSLGCRFTVQILPTMKLTSVIYNLFYIVHLGVLRLSCKAAKWNSNLHYIFCLQDERFGRNRFLFWSFVSKNCVHRKRGGF